MAVYCEGHVQLADGDFEGARGEQDHPAGEMARYWLQAGLLAWFWSCVSSTWPQYFLGHVVFLSLPYKASNLT